MEDRYIAAVEQRRGADVQGRLERPSDDARLANGSVVLSGWATGTSATIVAVELLRDSVVFRSVALELDREDVAAAFPNLPRSRRSGFRTEVPINPGLRDTIVVQARFDDGRSAPLATVHLRRGPLLDPGALFPPPPGEYDLPSAEAGQRFRSSPAMRWAKLIDDAPPPGTAWQRISSAEVFEPLLRPAFTIRPEDKIFAIGSCFARGVEGALSALGMDVASKTDVFDDLPMRSIGWPQDFTNKYNTEAVRNELLWALEPGCAYPRDALLRLPNGLYQDPYAASNLEFGDEADSLERHGLLTALTKRIVDCRIVVITLGLIEAFWDTQTGLYTNTTPNLAADEARFRFRVLSFEQTMEGLADIYELLAKHGHPDLQIVVTVSPVPLEATFTGEDVVIANTLSKATLRTAAGAWTRRHENVHYFPSYEIVSNSPNEAVWRNDGRHVRSEFVHEIMDLFVRTHLPAPEARTGAEEPAPLPPGTARDRVLR